jgi:hypothetical protein
MNTINIDNELIIKQNGGNIEYKTDLMPTFSSISAWPVTLVNNLSVNPAYVKFDSPSGNVISIDNVTKYFICGSSNLTFDVQPSFTAISVSAASYPGLIKNGVELTPGYSNIVVNNININAVGSGSLALFGGWIGQRFFRPDDASLRCIFNNCSSNGNISLEGGGIIGRDCSYINLNSCSSSGTIDSRAGGLIGFLNSDISINSSFSSGLISGEDAGGLTGSSCNTITITSSYSTNTISGSRAGGIFGSSVINGTAINCYSNGDITGSFSGGGIFGAYSNNGIATNCYSTGSISSYNSGGIFGEIQNNKPNSASFCFSKGIISGNNSGGIFGFTSAFDLSSNTTSAIKCYSEGNITGNQSGGIFGGNGGSNCIALASYCYALGTIGNNTGGIFGGNAAISGGSATAEYCFSVGSIGLDSGGIFGQGFNTSGNCLAIKCYTSGVKLTNGGIYSGSDNDDLFGSNNFSQANSDENNGIWTVSNILNNDPTLSRLVNNDNLQAPTYNSGFTSLTNRSGSIWSDISINPINPSTPWVLSGIGYSPYTSSLTNSASISVATPSTPSAQPVNNTYTNYQILSINDQLPNYFPITIQQTTDGPNIAGTLNPGGQNPGVYSLKIYSSKNPYVTSELTFNILCLYKDSTVLTPSGFIPVCDLKQDDYVITHDYRLVKIKRIYSFLIEPTPEHLPWKIPKDFFFENYPPNDCHLTGGHLVLVGKRWFRSKQNSNFVSQLKLNEPIQYYHIELSNYITDNLVINGGLAVESLGNQNENKERDQNENKIRGKFGLRLQNKIDQDYITNLSKIYNQKNSNNSLYTADFCLFKDTTVLTLNGFKPISELKQYDFILTSNYKLSKILDISKHIKMASKETIPWKIPKNYFGNNYPENDCHLYLKHSILFDMNWINLSLLSENEKISQLSMKKFAEFYEIKLENNNDTLVINNGLIIKPTNSIFSIEVEKPKEIPQEKHFENPIDIEQDQSKDILLDFPIVIPQEKTIENIHKTIESIVESKNEIKLNQKVKNKKTITKIKPLNKIRRI